MPGEHQIFEYDESEMPWKLATTGLGDTFLEYDAASSRTAKRGPSETTVYAGDLYECVGPTLTSSGQTFGCAEHRYKVYAGGGLTAQITRNSSGATIETRYVHGDHLGSSTLLTNESGVVLGQRTFGVFGTTQDLSNRAFHLEQDTNAITGRATLAVISRTQFACREPPLRRVK